MKRGKVVVIGSNHTTVEMQTGSTGAIALLMVVVIGVIGVVGAAVMCQTQADFRRKTEEPRD